MESQDLPNPTNGLTYAAAGVDVSKAGSGLANLLSWVNKTKEFRSVSGVPLLDIGYFANVIDLGGGVGLAISTDGVGTKILIAQQIGKYETVGIDCVAVNVNDIIAVGAEPIALVDTISMEAPEPQLLEELGKGMYQGAQLANIAIVGGEMAQVPDLLKGPRPGHAFDLVGTCVGLVPVDRIIVGQDIKENDVVIGLASSGVHCNGLTLARKALLDMGGLQLEKYLPELGRTLAEELLQPTHIYVSVVMGALKLGLRIKALTHVSGDGLLNLARIKSPMGFVIDHLPDPLPIFSLIQETGQVSNEEMFTVFNMGVGFCMVVDPSDVDEVLKLVGAEGLSAYRMGVAVADSERKVKITPYGLVGENGKFRRE
jgi:phosphoribosylformylglycinamidine cyclo-ligase